MKRKRERSKRVAVLKICVCVCVFLSTYLCEARNLHSTILVRTNNHLCGHEGWVPVSSAIMAPVLT